MDWKSLLEAHSQDQANFNTYTAKACHESLLETFTQSFGISIENSTFLKINGPDSVSFLQGQVTCDVDDLDIGRSIHGAHLNPQGKVIFTFVLTKISNEQLLLKMNSKILEIALSSLKKYSIFSKVDISVTEEFQSFFLSPKTNVLLESCGMPCFTVNTVKNHCSAAISKEHIPKLLELIKTKCTLYGKSIITILRFNFGLVEIYPDTSSKFIPQVLNLDNLNFISFTKGCYTGQEIVARTHYLGKAKKTLQSWQVYTKNKIHLNQKLYNDQGLPIATIIEFFNTENDCIKMFVITNQKKEIDQVYFDNGSSAKCTMPKQINQ